MLKLLTITLLEILQELQIPTSSSIFVQRPFLTHLHAVRLQSVAAEFNGMDSTS